MKKNQFFVELKNPLNEQDFTNLRFLYSPVVGIKAISLYQLLFDYYKVNKNSKHFYMMNELSAILGMTQDETIQERKKLEAVGLIRAFEKADNNTFIFKINKPLNPEQFRQNNLLFKSAISKIGEIIFERIEFSQKTSEFDKHEYSDISTKYQDLFKIRSEQAISNTLEVAIPSAKSIEEAIGGLNFSQFIYYLTGSKISPSQLNIFQNIYNQGFSTKSLNLIIDYSYKVNDRIVANHVKKITEDFISNEIKDSYSIEKELNAALEARKKDQKTIDKNLGTKIAEDNEEDDQDWEELFSSIGGF